jgi:protein-disulfide isomerase-like protein with CxxC motif
MGCLTMPIDATHFSDPGCPWAYSVSPAHAVLRWRYADGLRWRLVTIGLTEHGSQYEARGYTPQRSALAAQRFRGYGMPFGAGIKRRIAGTSRACRAIVATRLQDPAREFEVFRALQLMQFTTTRLLDDDDDLEVTLSGVAGLDARAIVGAIESSDVIEAYERDRAESRTAAGSPTEFQGKAGRSDGPVRYTAPSVIFALGDRRMEAGGFQTVEAYDVLIANLDPALDRRPAAGPDDLPDVLDAFPEGLTTTEVAAIMTAGNDAPDPDAAERALVGLAADGGARREPVGDGVLWQPAHARIPTAATG